jgi:hypothetical protein
MDVNAMAHSNGSQQWLTESTETRKNARMQNAGTAEPPETSQRMFRAKAVSLDISLSSHWSEP